MVEKEAKLEDIRKLSAKQRIEKLRELEERNRREIQEAEQLISESQKEAQVADLLEEISVPSQKDVKIDELFSSGIEEIVEKEKKDRAMREEENSKIDSPYQINLRDKTTPQLYQNLSEFQKNIIEKGYANPYEQKKIETFSYEVRRREEGYKAAHEIESEKFIDSKGIVNYMRKFLR